MIVKRKTEDTHNYNITLHTQIGRFIMADNKRVCMIETWFSWKSKAAVTEKFAIGFD